MKGRKTIKASLLTLWPAIPVPSHATEAGADQQQASVPSNKKYLVAHLLVPPHAAAHLIVANSNNNLLYVGLQIDIYSFDAHRNFGSPDAFLLWRYFFPRHHQHTVDGPRNIPL